MSPEMSERVRRAHAHAPIISRSFRLRADSLSEPHCTLASVRLWISLHTNSFN